ncbi:MAG TPA: 3-dehydroquinate synthase family protein [Bacteroidales bacterium]|nr:3-dehydroquinate synthase family protein [Bacteroidales bacterium]
MKRIDFHIKERSSAIIVGELLKNVPSYIPKKKVFIITDSNIRRLYSESFPKGFVYEIKPGEASKVLAIVEDICLKLAEEGADRESFILGIGGGVVCDLTGLVASLFMRGVSHGFVSTTLLSQVDASVGGKTGVNAGGYKNSIGTFKLPEFVICDVTMLSTLPETEYISGFGELVKTAAIADRSMFYEITERKAAIMSRNIDLMEDLIYRSLLIKTSVVGRDFEEAGERRLLNFGHTFGHPIEVLNKTSHGMAVMQGMILAGQWSVKKGFLAEKHFFELKSLVESYGISPVKCLPDGFKQLVSGDKKKSGDSIYFVFLMEPGRAEYKKVPVKEMFEFLDSIEYENK